MGNSLLYGKKPNARVETVQLIKVCDRFEIGQRRTHRDKEMSSATSRNSHVLTEDRCPLIGRYCDEMNVASATLTDNGLAICGLHVLYPIGIRAEHRYEVAL